MAQVSDTWSATLNVAWTTSLGTTIEGYLTALQAGVNSINDSQLAAGASADLAKAKDASLTDAKVDWTDLTACRAAAAGVKVVTGTTSVTVASGTASKTESVDLDADGDNSPTNFSSTTALRIVVAIEGTITAGDELIADIDNVAADSFDITVRTPDNSNVASDRTVTVNWIAIGPA